MVNEQRTPLMIAVTYVVEAQRRNNGNGVDMESHSFCGVVEINGDGVVSLCLHPGYGIKGLSPTGGIQGPRQNGIPQDTQQEIQPRPNLSPLHYATSCHLHSHLLLHRHASQLCIIRLTAIKTTSRSWHSALPSAPSSLQDHPQAEAGPGEVSQMTASSPEEIPPLLVSGLVDPTLSNMRSKRSPSWSSNPLPAPLISQTIVSLGVRSGFLSSLKLQQVGSKSRPPATAPVHHKSQRQRRISREDPAQQRRVRGRRHSRKRAPSNVTPGSPPSSSTPPFLLYRSLVVSRYNTVSSVSVLLFLPPLAETGTFGPVPQQLLHCSALDHLDISNIVAPSLSNYDKLMAVNVRGMAA
ncbi:hypothetical protein ACFX2I_038423 [Malus domestica]